MKLYKLTIKNKLISIFIFSLIVIVGTGIYSIKTIENVNDRSTVIVIDSIPGIQKSGDSNTMTSDFRILEFDHITAVSNGDMKKIEKLMDEKNNE